MRRIAIALVLALGAPASAQARVHTIAPPGNSGVGQYLETVPTARGAQPTNSVHPVVGGVGSGRPPGGTQGTAVSPAGSAIPPSTRRALARQGATGAAAAALAQATAPTPRAATGEKSAMSGGGSSPASSVIKTLTGSNSGSGLGPVLPTLLIVSLLGAAVMALVRRRRTS
ncbi:MAG: hypothetical protein ACTHMY_11790 [Solirubrobacteraceae bacterium]